MVAITSSGKLCSSTDEPQGLTRNDARKLLHRLVVSYVEDPASAETQNAEQRYLDVMRQLGKV